MEDFVNLSISDLIECINQPGIKVKEPPHNFVKNEFDKFVNKEISQRRKNSSISDLRNFHNFIKRVLIENVSELYRKQHPREDLNLLDLACGRGGDLFKFESAGIKNVFGFDKSETSIESIDPFDQGAKARYNNQNLHVNVEFFVNDAMQPTQELINKLGVFMNKHKLINKKIPSLTGFQIMSCQFAMHYFFQSEIALRNVLGTFSQFLKKGGYFIGTTVNGKKISNLLGNSPSFDSTLLNITKNFKSIAPRLPYNNSYNFKINDTFDKGNYFNTMGVSTEYLVNLTELKRVAAEYNLQPVYLNFFEPLNSSFTTSPDFISFEEIYELAKPITAGSIRSGSVPAHGKWKGKSLTEDELVINNLYTTFIFVKV